MDSSIFSASKPICYSMKINHASASLRNFRVPIMSARAHHENSSERDEKRREACSGERINNPAQEERERDGQRERARRHVSRDSRLKKKSVEI